ncbi:hypothetical protein FN846DRAFT_282627 [Sphaerosporella brunnea]|uniref:ABC-2 type transporter transmembrane domain-containing protein n=1 Tax=Sphaerosporella brunnea TaxID=1250544 RepID=A0A5J5EMC3_9PEZI|nr:hypothetical protein FN846DRAFT_282627 [Sphaerosporella brunnea]
MGLSGCLSEAIVMGLIAGWIFYNLDGSLSGIRSRQAALYMAANLQGYLILLFETYRLCEVDIRVFDREHGEGVVGVFAYLVSRRLAKLFTEDIPVPFLFAVLFYFMCGFDKDAAQFLHVLWNRSHLAVPLCGFATLAVSISRNFGEATLISNLFYTMQSMCCGFFIQQSTIPVYVR